MISYSVYKVLHLSGVLMVFLALGGARDPSWRRPAAITHGLGLLISLVAGFGLLARIGVMHGSMPGWAVAKIGIWVILAAMIGLVIRKNTWAKPAWILIVLLGATAAFLAGYKPF